MYNTKLADMSFEKTKLLIRRSRTTRLSLSVRLAWNDAETCDALVGPLGTSAKRVFFTLQYDTLLVGVFFRLVTSEQYFISFIIVYQHELICLNNAIYLTMCSACSSHVIHALQ